jgi:hypothetical protein
MIYFMDSQMALLFIFHRYYITPMPGFTLTVYYTWKSLGVAPILIGG